MKTDTVRGRIGLARATLSTRQIAIGLGLLAALTFALLFVQEPMLHDSLHDMRHSTGITCH